MTGKLEGKVAFVTGAARGQGRSHAVKLASEGADIIAVDACAGLPTVPYDLATEADLAETVRLIEELDRRVVAHKVDVRDLEGLTAAVADGVATLGRLDIILANAGISSFASAAELTEEQWTEMVDVNLNGVWRAYRAGIRHIQAGGVGGAIVITSSVAGLRGIPNVAHYAAAKHGVVGLMRVLALEHGREQIRVNTIHPTNVNTGMIQNEPTLDLFLPGRTDRTQEDFARVAKMLNVLPIPWVEPETISEMVLFLVSDAGRFITGSTIPIDAGMSMRW
jgi:SDR family mycofactocin-dependent oxidoreductase